MINAPIGFCAQLQIKSKKQNKKQDLLYLLWTGPVNEGSNLCGSPVTQEQGVKITFKLWK